jgi:glycosyltransferase involved in cell wall biosynthesis
MAHLRVSIVTASYNMASFLERTLRSILCQDYNNIEYLVLDSCSTDGTGDILRRYKDALDILIVEKDRGQADALSRGLRMATGDILAYLNADDCLTSSHTITQVVRYFENNPAVDVVCGQRYFVNREGEYLSRDPYRQFSGQALKSSNPIAQEATFWRRGIYEKAGGYIDQNYHCALDYELWLRMLLHGAEFLSVPEVWGLFRSYPEQKTTALWKSVVMPEVERIQERYLGYRITEQEMFDRHDKYLFGVTRHESPELHQFYHRLWFGVHERSRAALSGIPLDRWMESTPLNMERLEHLYRSRRVQPSAA